MLVRVVWNKRQNNAEPAYRFALACAGLLTPLSVIAFTITFWSMAANLHWTSTFFVSAGLFSHWQVWLITAAALLLASRLLNSYANRQNGPVS